MGENEKHDKMAKEPEEPENQSEEIDYKNMAQRIQAEFINYKNRVEGERAQFVKFANKELILKLLTISDQFEIALKTIKEESILKGFDLLYAQLIDVLKKEGVEPMESMNKQFDPNLHEALMQEESDQPSGTIIEEIQKGYMINDTVLRPAKVKVSK